MSLQAFDVLHAANLSALLKDDVPTHCHVTCLEVCGDLLFVGFRDGTILRCRRGRSAELEATSRQRLSGGAQPVVQLKAVSALDLLLVQRADDLTALQLETLEPIGGRLALRNVQAFCLNEDPPDDGDPFAVEAAVAIRKKIRRIRWSRESVETVAEFSTPAPADALAMDGVHLCYSAGGHYWLLNVVTGNVQQLFGSDSADQPALVRRFSKGEFLGIGPGRLGVFVSTLFDGISERPPIDFGGGRVTSMALHAPYTLAAVPDGVQVYSCDDQKRKQSLALANVRCLADGDGQIYAATAVDLFSLRPVSWRVQVDQLLAEERVDEALQVAEGAAVAAADRPHHRQLLAGLQRRAAVGHIGAGRFDRALHLFDACAIDCRHVLALLPAQGGSAEDSDSRRVLFEYLKRRRTQGLDAEQLMAVDAALLERYTSGGDDDDGDAAPLLALVGAGCGADPAAVVDVLTSRRRFHALAVYHAGRGNADAALDVWSRLARGHLVDRHFPGVDFVVDQLVRCGDWNAIWRHGANLLQADEAAASRLFTDAFRAAPDAVDAESVCDFLQPHPLALGRFLEFQVNERAVDSVALHTRLALHYIGQIGNVAGAGAAHRSQVNRLRALLRTSTRLDLARVSRALAATPHLPHESAIVCGRLGDHRAAVEIFIHQLQDFDAAEEYCACVEEAAAWSSLVEVCAAGPAQGALMDRLVDALRRRPSHFDAASALRRLPDATRLDALAPYVNFVLREALHFKRMQMIRAAMAQVESLESRYELARASNECFALAASSYCPVCKRHLSIEQGVARYPNGVVTHVQCAANHHVCPLTGHQFHLERCRPVD